MIIYLDTSSLIKLYHTEAGTKELDDIFQSNQVTEVFVSSMAKVEFNSALWKKVRTKNLMEEEATSIIESFKTDYTNYNFIEVTNEVILTARELVSHYGLNGLRTLDSVQLASMIKVKPMLDFAITADGLLKAFIESEGISTR
jgi:uncharacterized protein